MKNCRNIIVLRRVLSVRSIAGPVLRSLKPHWGCFPDTEGDGGDATFVADRELSLAATPTFIRTRDESAVKFEGAATAASTTIEIP
jgi:hypothetical protein